MKNLLRGSLFIILFTGISCSEEEVELSKDRQVNLKFHKNFENSKYTDIEDFEELTVIIDGHGNLQIDENILEVISTTHVTTGQSSLMIIRKTRSNAAKNDQDDPGIERGWFFTGECFEYGYMITDDKGNKLFDPCGTKCIGFDPVCPGFNEGFA